MLKAELAYQTILNQLPNFVFWKDQRYRLQGGNSLFIQAAGFSQECDLIGKSDYDLPWQEYADEYHEWDKEILKGYHLINHVEYHQQASKDAMKVIVSKKPLLDQQGIIGIIGTFTLLHEPSSTLNVDLPPQQKNCLKLIACGLSAKQIAYKMRLSPRTVEYYIAILKEKLNCRNKADLIIKACLL